MSIYTETGTYFNKYFSETILGKAGAENLSEQRDIEIIS